MEIRNPRRILVLGPPGSGALDFLRDLTGSAPEPKAAPSETPSPSIPSKDGELPQTTAATTTTAGLTHTLSLTTKYYTANIDLWVDEIPLAATAVSSWTEDFTSSSAAEVVRAVGAWIVVFHFRDILDTSKTAELKKLLSGVKSAINSAYADEGGEEAWDGVLLAVGIEGGLVGKDEEGVDEGAKVEQIEDTCFDAGFEFVDARKGKRSSRLPDEAGGRPAKGGIDRVREALEVNDWNAEQALGDEDSQGFDVAELEDLSKGLLDGANVSLADLKIGGPDDEQGWMESGDDEGVQVEKLEQLMRRMQVAREAGAHMSEAERKKFAAKTVNEIMKKA